MCITRPLLFVADISEYFMKRDCIVKITVNLRRLGPDEDTASSTPQPAYKTGYNLSLFCRGYFNLLYDGENTEIKEEL